ncbi:outer membrane beta-barrel protein [Lentisalinibacter sediminis]|uniref:outer membrane beta-barrel protein n=1 Tax=Lentisalinibacter sediminis TaxID=2992237 RepID=UPI0038696B0F
MKKLILAIALLTVSVPASAQWVAGGGYVNLSDEEDGLEVDLGAIYGSIGYLIEGEGNFSFLPELRLGFGIADDTVLGVDVEVDNFLALSVRGQYTFESGLYLFANPSYARLEVTASAGGFSVSEDDWEFGVGGGAGYKFTQQFWGELAYETYDGTDAWGIGFKYAF